MTLAVLQASVLQTNGALSVAAGAQITVRTPAGALATLYEDRAGTTPTGANPIFADSKGFFRVYVAPGRYDVTVTTSSGTQVYENIALFADGSVIGTAAAADLTTSPTDTTAGRALKVGDFGLGVAGNPPLIIDADDVSYPNGLYRYRLESGSINGPANYGTVFIQRYASEVVNQTFILYTVTNITRIFVRNNNGVSWSPWREIYHTGNLLGTVSATGTYPNLVPTGAIMEAGSNANGQYVKYADGTMICRHAINLGSAAAFGAGTYSNPYRTTVFNWTYPAVFVVTPILAATQSCDSGAAAERALTVSSNSVGTSSVINIQAVRVTDNTGTTDVIVYLNAIGRWK